MNSDISKAIKTMRKSNYFSAWNEVLLGDTACVEWELMLKNSENRELYDALAHKLHASHVPYVIVNEYIDEFFRYCKRDSSRHKIKNNIAKAYLKKKLRDDRALIEVELDKKITVSLESKQELINAHLVWMKHFINTIIGEPQYFELDPTKCHVGRWLIKEKDDVPLKLVEEHKNLHSMAQSALRMYAKKDYAYFLLLYTDMLSASYQIRDTILNIYFERRLASIYQDPLTSKANYLQLKYDLGVNDSSKSILMFNIKEFKKINLLYGHEAADKIIVLVSQLVDEIKDITGIYRIYGDEFALMFLSRNKAQVIEAFKRKLYDREFHIGNKKISLSFYSSTSEITKHILEYCEYGLMISKKHLGDVVDVNSFDKETFMQYANEINLSQKLKLAFLDNRIINYYQPIMDLKKGEITKYEVLMRVTDIDGTILTPPDFLDVLKEMYVYPEVTKLIIKNSFEYFKDNRLEFSVNLSYADISNEDTKAFIIEILKKNQDIAYRCTFELLESEAIINESEVQDFFTSIHLHGAKIALDDFGVGYSNYDTIFKYNIDYIKIDGSLVKSLLVSERSRTLVESISTVSKKMGAKVILEYVSSQEVFDEVSKMDAEYAQGYYVGLPNSSLDILKV